MRKICFILLCFFINIGLIYASSGPLKESSIVSCGKTYGYHGSDKHYHVALKKNGKWTASGKSLGKTNPCGKSNKNVKSKSDNVTFFECVDGDTAKFILNKKEITVRFLAIDTPETKHPTKKEQPFGKEASNYTCNALKKANKITLEYDPNSDEFDKYDRYLAWVYTDGELLQEKLVSKGLAKVAYLYDDYLYTKKLEKIETKAKEKRLGIWSNNSSDDSENDSEKISIDYEKLLKKLFKFIESLF